jgi:hypothetical protein
VSYPRNNMAFVAIKMVRRQECGTGVSPVAVETEETGETPVPLCGRGSAWAVFPRYSLLTYQFRYARRSCLEKQPTDPAAARRKPCYFVDRTLR